MDRMKEEKCELTFYIFRAGVLRGRRARKKREHKKKEKEKVAVIEEGWLVDKWYAGVGAADHFKDFPFV